MRRLSLILIALVALAALGGGAAYWYAGRLPGPTIEIARPEKFVGVTTPLEVVIEAPRAELTTLEIAFEQNGARTPLYILGSAAPDAPAAERVTDADRVRVTREVGRESVPGIKSGPARIVVTGNPGCITQIAGEARRQGLALEVLHPVELLGRALLEG